MTEDSTITRELPIIKVEKGYVPFEEGKDLTIEFNLTSEQFGFIDEVAEKHNISFQQAFNVVWKDAFDLLSQARYKMEKYINKKAK